MIRESLLLANNLLHRIEEALQISGVTIGVGITKLRINLGERCRTERTFAITEIYIDEFRRARLQVGGKRKTNVIHWRETRNYERERSDLLFIFAVRVLPRRMHRAGVFADGNRNAEFRAEIKSDFLDGIVKYRVFAGIAARSHPVGRKTDLTDVADIGCREVRNRLGNRHTAGSGAIEKRDRSTLAGRHRLTIKSLVAHRRNGAVGGGKLIPANHLIARYAARNRAVGNRNKERLIGDRGKMENARQCVDGLNTLKIRGLTNLLDALDIADHARRLAEKNLDVHINRLIAEMLVLENKLAVARRDADERDGAALALAERFEERPGLGLESENITLLSLAAPNFHRVHRLLFVMDRTERELTARSLDELGAAVRKTARADIMDRENRVSLAE